MTASPDWPMNSISHHGGSQPLLPESEVIDGLIRTPDPVNVLCHYPGIRPHHDRVRAWIEAKDQDFLAAYWLCIDWLAEVLVQESDSYGTCSALRCMCRVHIKEFSPVITVESTEPCGARLSKDLTFLHYTICISSSLVLTHTDTPSAWVTHGNCGPTHAF